MGDDEIQDQQLPNQSQQETEHIEVSNPNEHVDSSQPIQDSQSDEKKDDSVGSALGKHSYSREELEGAIKAKEFISSQDFIDRRTKVVRETVEAQRGILEKWESGEEPEPYKGAIADQIEVVNYAQTEFDVAINKARLRQAEAVEETKEETLAVGDHTISPYEELYSLNPDAFANTSTAEFMKLVEELAKLDRRFAFFERGVDEISKYKSRVDYRFEKGEIVRSSDMAALPYDIVEFLPELFSDSEAFSQLEQRLEAISRDGWFDKTPRQIMEGYRAIIDEYLPKIEAKKQTAKQQRQAILDRYRT